MAKKKFLIENGAQVWPITRMDCIYTEDGKNLANLHYASKNFVLDDCLGGKKIRYVTNEEYNNLTDEQRNDESIIWNILDAEVTVATPDWNETDETSPSYIANKPDLSELEPKIDDEELDSMLFDIFGIEPETSNNN